MPSRSLRKGGRRLNPFLHGGIRLLAPWIGGWIAVFDNGWSGKCSAVEHLGPGDTGV